MAQAPSRRDFHRAALAAAGSPLVGSPVLFGDEQPRQGRGTIESIQHLGVLIRECTLPGERRADDVVPAHPNGLQVSRDRWLLVYATRGFRGVDDDRSIVYQLRRGTLDGPVLKEGFLARSINDWDPFNEGKRYVRQHGHPVAFGVPKRALIKGKPVPHANLFAAKWRVTARVLDPETNRLLHGTKSEDIGSRTQGVEWVQFRLNDREDDIEIVQPAGPLRQKGFEKGKAFCAAEGVVSMNQSFTSPVPFTADASEWADCNHFDGGRIAPLRYAYNPKLQHYEWAQTGSLLGDKRRTPGEASLSRLGERWIISARVAGKGGVGWVSAADLFGRLPEPVYPAEPTVGGPSTSFVCADGALRLFGGDGVVSPHRNARDPLYCWDVNPEEFACTNRRVIFDSVKTGLRIRREAVPKIDMCKLLAPQGKTQWLVHRVSVRSYNLPYVGGSGQPTGIPAINREERDCCAIYYARIAYSGAATSLWEFERA